MYAQFDVSRRGKKVLNSSRDKKACTGAGRGEGYLCDTMDDPSYERAGARKVGQSWDAKKQTLALSPPGALMAAVEPFASEADARGCAQVVSDEKNIRYQGRYVFFRCLRGVHHVHLRAAFFHATDTFTFS